jgi:hypothetical protein
LPHYTQVKGATHYKKAQGDNKQEKREDGELMSCSWTGMVTFQISDGKRWFCGGSPLNAGIA